MPERFELNEPTHAALPAIPPQRYNSSVPSADTTPIRLDVLFFGRLKDTIGHAQESMEIPPDSRIEDLFAKCVARYPGLAAHRQAIAVSRNREFAAWSTPLHPGDEVAFLPPVSGG
jgi:molybdopterin converting factor small subunit